MADKRYQDIQLIRQILVQKIIARKAQREMANKRYQDNQLIRLILVQKNNLLEGAKGKVVSSKKLEWLKSERKCEAGKSVDQLILIHGLIVLTQ